MKHLLTMEQLSEKEILSILGINGETIYINGILEINELDFLLDESVSFIVIKESK